jgi:GNAT superfamily N-acetyltransferase
VATKVLTVADRPALAQEGIPSEQVWPEYNLHGQVTTRLWPRLYDDLPAFQFGLYDDATGELLAEGHTVPCWWDGSEAGLSSGVDETLQAAIDRLDAGGSVNTLCAVAAEIPPRSRGRGLARALLQAMSDIAEQSGLRHLIAPVRPSMKDRYPITPIDRYVTWRRGDGQLFDPWMRVHEALGARIGPTLARSLHITGSVAQWEAWTGLAFPDSGHYVFPLGLAPVSIDRGTDVGSYWEPNVWMIHR